MTENKDITIDEETYNELLNKYEEISSLIRFLYLQGKITKETYDYINSIFKSYEPKNIIDKIINSTCEIDEEENDDEVNKCEDGKRIGF
jgi:uncharacterized protein YpuA (DUF1002 family)